MKYKEIDDKISLLVTEKKLLQKSYDITNDEYIKKEINKRLIRIYGEIQKAKKTYESEGFNEKCC